VIDSDIVELVNCAGIDHWKMIKKVQKIVMEWLGVGDWRLLSLHLYILN